MKTIHSARLLIAAAVLSMAGAAYAQDSHDLSTRYEGRGVLRELNVEQPEFYRPGEVIDFEVLGRPRGSASVSISTSRGAKLLPLTETSPGVYEGTYRVRRGDDFTRPAFSATLSRRGVVGKAWASPDQPRHARAHRDEYRDPHIAGPSYEARYARPAMACQTCGVITDIRMVERGSREANAPGIIIGGIVGGVLGNQVGGGSGRDVATVLGALAGGAAGNEIGKNQARDPEWLITVRLDNGSSQTFRNSHRPNVGQGQRVRVENDQLIVDERR
jgi:outer membrane lipoprotein SlyB